MKFFNFFVENFHLFFETPQSLNVSGTLTISLGSTTNMLPWAFLKIQKPFIGTPMCFFEKTQILNLERVEKPYFFSRILQQVCYLLPFLKTSIFLREAHLLFQKTQTLSVFRSRTISVAIYGKFATSWLKKFSNTGSTNVGSFTKAHLANMGWKHKMIWEEDFAFRFWNLAQNEIEERCHFCKFLLWKPVLDFFLLTSMKEILTKDVDSFNP